MRFSEFNELYNHNMPQISIYLTVKFSIKFQVRANNNDKTKNSAMLQENLQSNYTL